MQIYHNRTRSDRALQLCCLSRNLNESQTAVVPGRAMRTDFRRIQKVPRVLAKGIIPLAKT